MTKAKLFMTGRSQAVRLPAEFRFEGSEVDIRRAPNRRGGAFEAYEIMG
jgi:antitoxin VapB